MGDSFFFVPASLEHQRREKSKAKDLRKTQWWKSQLGRGVCAYCLGKFGPQELTMDHQIPIVRGGLTSKKNCVPCCKDCNSKKGSKTLSEMAMEEFESKK
ncbi:MAG: HNH endonuclease [Bdellovibrionaceae bacterium]|nr:HNH endonuclease [Pseudobdellovibrionaceae bacterium]